MPLDQTRYGPQVHQCRAALPWSWMPERARSRWSTCLTAWLTPLSDETHGQVVARGGRDAFLAPHVPRPSRAEIAMLGAYDGLLRNPGARRYSSFATACTRPSGTLRSLATSRGFRPDDRAPRMTECWYGVALSVLVRAARPRAAAGRFAPAVSTDRSASTTRNSTRSNWNAVSRAEHHDAPPPAAQAHQ